MEVLITVPEWFLYVLSITSGIYCLNTLSGIYLSYLQYKLSKKGGFS